MKCAPAETHAEGEPQVEALEALGEMEAVLLPDVHEDSAIHVGEGDRVELQDIINSEFEIFACGNATSRLRCNVGASRKTNVASDYAQVVRPKLQASNANSARRSKACSALASGVQ